MSSEYSQVTVMLDIQVDLMSNILASPTQVSYLGQLKWTPESSQRHANHGPHKSVVSSLHSKPMEKNTMTRPIVLALGRLSWGQLSSRVQNSLIPPLLRETPTPWKCYPLEAVETPTMLLSTTSSCCSKGEDAWLKPISTALAMSPCFTGHIN